jgi:filamentous hemagglutinin family protein
MPRLPPVSPGYRRRRLALLSGLVWLWALLAVSHAQITLDGSLGPHGPLPSPNYLIGAELGQTRGGNLFHSFGQFNVRTGESATFTGPATIANIVGRVTGGQPSAIDGLLRSEIAGAHLFLLNPNGIMVGPHASLDVQGSLHVSTADYLRFADGATFFATLGQESVLTVAAPTAFGFLGNHPAAIAIQSSEEVGSTSLVVRPRETLSVVGGDITLTGRGSFSTLRLIAGLGRLQLASVASPGEVVFRRLDLAPDLQVDSFTRLGRIEVSRGVALVAGGSASDGSGGGIVVIRSGRLLVDQSVIASNYQSTAIQESGLGVDLRVAEDIVIRNGSNIQMQRGAPGRARVLQITAGSVHVDASEIGSAALPGGGNAGDFLMNVGTLRLTGGARIASDTSVPGQGGEITIVANDLIAIAGRGRVGPSGVFSNASGSGDGGRIIISTPTLTMDDGLLQTLTMTGSSGNAGIIDVRAGRLTLTGGAQIDSSTQGPGRGGDVSVVATEATSITGVSSALRSNTLSSGDAGRVFVSTPLLTMDARGIIQASTLLGSGNAGSIDVRAGRLTLTGGALISSSTYGMGRGGDVTVEATDVQLTVGGISAFSGGTGNAGNLRLTARNTFQSDRSLITADAAQASGGNIELKAGSMVRLRDSWFTTSVGGGPTTVGGNLTLIAPSVIAERSLVTAQAFAGMGGRIDITADVFLADPASLVDASSRVGISGTVDIRAPVTTLSGTLAPLPQAFVNVAELLPARCAARFSGGKASSLVLGGRDGLPLEPGGVLPSPLVLGERLAADPTLTGDPHRQTSAATFALLAGQEKALPRLGCPK